jgi:predicted RNase H-like nuclease (RuvC/YqgF family)
MTPAPSELNDILDLAECAVSLENQELLDHTKELEREVTALRAQLSKARDEAPLKVFRAAMRWFRSGRVARSREEFDRQMQAVNNLYDACELAIAQQSKRRGSSKRVRATPMNKDIL